MQNSNGQISIELEPRDGTIAGRLVDGTQVVPFVGWLALTAALEAARARRAREESNHRRGGP